MAPKKVLIIGAGSAGMSAAYALASSPDTTDRWQITVMERSDVLGGMATSVEIDAGKYGASYINDGVQGASPVFHNTFAMFDKLGFKSSKVGMQCSFGKSEDEHWSNVYPSQVIDEYQSDIKKFGRVLNIIKTFEPVFAMMSVQAMLRLFRFSKGFGETIVFPLVALFFGTGNQTPFISAAILERVFKDPSMRLFEYSPKSFLASIPEMRAFPRLSLLYSTWGTLVQQLAPSARLLTNHEVVSVSERSSKYGAKVVYRKVERVDNDLEAHGASEEVEERFDELILACDADSALKILGKDATWLEKKVLGNVKYLWDVTVTHSDEKYMDKYYNLKFDRKKMSSDKRADDKEAQEAYDYAEKDFKPLYYIRSYPDDKKKIEMSFDLTYYQPQFDGTSEAGPEATGVPAEAKDRSSFSSDRTRVNIASGGKLVKPKVNDSEETSGGHKHVFQTIFLDRDDSSHKWTIEEVAKEEVILTKWWKQQSHRWQHYAGTVPWMMWINGQRRTHFAGAWSILNMHEIGVVSGFAAAYRLGAAYPFADNEDCKRLFLLYLAASHGVRMRKEDRSGILF